MDTIESICHQLTLIYCFYKPITVSPFCQQIWPFAH